MAREGVKFEAPIGRILIQAYREEANWYDREEQPSKAARLRRLADKMDQAVKMRERAKQPK